MRNPEEIAGYLEKELGQNDEIYVLVDIEQVTHDTYTGNAEIANDRVLYENPDTDTEINKEDFSRWSGVNLASAKMARELGWPEEKRSDFLMTGETDDDSAERWEGFHEYSDMLWMDRADEIPFVEADYSIEMVSDSVPGNFARLTQMDHVEDTILVTSRGNFWSDYDVETALEERVSQDLSRGSGITEEDVRDMLHFSKDKFDKVEELGMGRPLVLIDDSPMRAQKTQDKEEIAQLAPTTFQNATFELPGRVYGDTANATGGFGKAVEGIELLAER